MLKRAHWLGAAAAAASSPWGRPAADGRLPVDVRDPADCPGRATAPSRRASASPPRRWASARPAGDGELPQGRDAGLRLRRQAVRQRLPAAAAGVSVSANGRARRRAAAPPAQVRRRHVLLPLRGRHLRPGTAAGTCVPSRELHHATPPEVCGCDGKTYATRCAAKAAGTSGPRSAPARAAASTTRRARPASTAASPWGPAPAQPLGRLRGGADGACSTFSSRPAAATARRTPTPARPPRRTVAGEHRACPCGGQGGVACRPTSSAASR